ncbi:Hypothetical protein KVN_LOCUS479 [uncultured virus]|nr:Hypothetical protein KVN_LOCUS479 [uncultured virus]
MFDQNLEEFKDFDAKVKINVFNFQDNNTTKKINSQKSETEIKKYKKNGINITYNKRTEEYYRVLRKRQLDPFSNHEISDEISFKFEYEWDPYTGERQLKDHHGPLCFDPDQLIRYFYVNRLKNLWVEPRQDENGYFEGYYEDGVGAGVNFHINGRGDHPEWYLFRLPIIDCYLTVDHNEQIITMGPKLTNDEIIQIEQKSKLMGNNYRKIFSNERPSLIQMKELYDLAISDNVDISSEIPPSELANFTNEQINGIKSKINRRSVDRLKKLRG